MNACKVLKKGLKQGIHKEGNTKGYLTDFISALELLNLEV